MTNSESTSPGDLILRAVDFAVDFRWPAAIERAREIQGGTVEDRVARTQRSFTRELTLVGAAAGATSAAPGLGTLSGMAVASSELVFSTGRTADLVLTVGAIHGISRPSIEERRAWVLSVLLFGEAASTGFTKLAGELGKGLGAKATRAIPTGSLQAINRNLGRTIITKYGTKRGAIAVGRLLPFGIGAAVGGSANYLITRGIGRYAHSFFSELPELLRDGPAPNRARQPALADPNLIEVSSVMLTSSTGESSATSDWLSPPASTRSFRDPAAVDAREAMVDAEHVHELNQWVRNLRGRLPEAIIPWFDPMDGGADAQILWLLEAPGPKATRERGGSGFISIDNNDGTAEITAETMSEAGVNRRSVVLWNAIPYYLGNSQRITAHTDKDLHDAGPLLEELIARLPNLQAVILGGRAAQAIWNDHAPQSAGGCTVIHCPHPSPQNVNTRPEARGKIIAAWSEALERIGKRN